MEVVYTSPLKRAQQTARILASQLAIPTETVNDIGERNFYGVLTGLTRNEAKTRYPDQIALLGDYHSTIRGGEAYVPFKTRVIATFNCLLSLNKRHVIAIVAHGGPISCLFREVLHSGEVKIEDCGYAQLVHNQGKFYIKSLHGIAKK